MVFISSRACLTIFKSVWSIGLPFFSAFGRAVFGRVFSSQLICVKFSFLIFLRSFFIVARYYIEFQI